MAVEFCLTRGGAKDSSTVSRKAKMENVRHLHDEGVPKVLSKVTIFLQRRCGIGRAASEAECLHRRPFATSGHRGNYGDSSRENAARVVEKPRAARIRALNRKLEVTIKCTTFCRIGGCEKRTSGDVANESSATCRGFAGFGCDDCSDRSAATDPSSNQNFRLHRHSCAFCAADIH